MKRLAACLLSLLSLPALAQNTNTLITAPSGSLKMNGRLVTGKLLVTSSDAAPLSLAGGGLSVEAISSGYVASCPVVAGGIGLGVCPVPDAGTANNGAGIRYNLVLVDTFSGRAIPINGVPSITGAVWSLDQYKPLAASVVPSTFAYSSGSGAPTGPVPSSGLYLDNATHYLYIADGTEWRLVTGPINISVYGVAGAVGDGVADDTAALVNACAQGPEVWLASSARYRVTSSITLPCDIRVIGSAKIVTTSATVTFGGHLQAPDDAQIFQVSGTGGIIFGAANVVPAAWFGAVGDGKTINTAAIRAALASCVVAGCDVALRSGTYLVDDTLSLPTDTGLIGPTVSNLITGRMVRLLTTSNSADIIDLGVKGNTSYANGPGQRLKRLMIGRTVLPATGSRGVARNGVMGTHIEGVTSADSYSDFYLNACPSGQDSLGDANNIATWQKNGVSGYPTGAALSGFEYDSENGVSMSSHLSHGDQIDGSSQPSGTSVTGLYVHGTSINDINVDEFSSAGINYGERIVYDGTGAQGTAFDLHHTQNIHDRCLVTCVSVTGIPANGSVNFEDLYAIDNSAAASAVTIVNSSGVKINGSELGNLQSGSVVALQGSKGNQVTNFKIAVNNGGSALYVYQSSGNIFTNGYLYGQQASPSGIMVAVLGLPYQATSGTPVGSIKNVFSNIRGDGYANTGIYFDQYSGLNILSAVDFTSPNISNVMSDNSGTKQVSANCPVVGVPKLVLGPAAGTGATVASRSPSANESVPFNNCRFDVTFTPGSGAAAGSPFGGNFQGMGTDGTAFAEAMSGVSCTITGIDPPAIASVPYSSSSFSEAVVSVVNAPTGVANYRVSCTP